jgi:hypothetical protein
MTEVKPGQFWRLWVHDYAYRETFLVEEVNDINVRGTTINGHQCGVDLKHLVSEGEQIEPPTFYGRKLEL